MDETAALLLDPTTEPDVSRFSVHQDQGRDPYLTVERLVSVAEITALYPRRVASTPLGYLVPPVASSSQGAKTQSQRRSRQRSTYQSPNLWSGPFWILAGEIDPVLESSPMWKVRRHATRYPKWKRIRRLRARYGCGELVTKSGVTYPGHACEAARLASLYDDLGWGYAITLDAPRGQFQKAWNAWASSVLRDWESGPRVEYRGFYLVSIARHPGGLVHAHLLVGGIPYAEIQRGLDTWSYGSDVRKVHHRWGALHYLLSGEHDPWRHRRDVFSHCPNVLERFESDNLQALAYLTRRQILRTASRRASTSMSARQRSARARTAARARWAVRF